MSEVIDWQEVRRRIAETPVVVPPHRVRKYKRTPEAIERRKVKSRERWRKFYHENLEYCHERQKAWEQANPDKIKAKRQRYYDKLKQDPERLERKRQRQREYKARLKLRLQQPAIIVQPKQSTRKAS